jgi:hypothetical protein
MLRGKTLKRDELAWNRTAQDKNLIKELKIW